MLGLEVVDFAKLLLLGVVVLIPGRGVVPRVLADNARPGVGAKLGAALLSGDSGLGRDGLLGLSMGLEGLTPGPTDCVNFRLELGGTIALPSLTVRLPMVLYDGVSGVVGKDPREEGE